MTHLHRVLLFKDSREPRLLLSLGAPLSISGERKAEKEEKGKKYHRVERSYGAFSRSFTLPEGTLAEKISAEFKDGVLMVHLPKEERAKARAIEVKIS